MHFEPGFASTGHSAQEKTLPNVLTWLHEGCFAAYVAASRARSHNGLGVIQPVTLSDLNKPLPYHLIQEAKQHQIMEHNTLVRHGFKAGDILVVPDPEEEQVKNFSKGKAIFNEPSHKRKKEHNKNNIDNPSVEKKTKNCWK
jgi:hypothetical protein